MPVCCAALSQIRQSLAVFFLTHVLGGTFIILHLMNCCRGAWLILLKPQQGCTLMRHAKSNKRLCPTRSHHGSRVSKGEGENTPRMARKNCANYQTGFNITADAASLAEASRAVFAAASAVPTQRDRLRFKMQ